MQTQITPELLTPLENGKYDIGRCKRLKIKCISEIGWLDNETLMGQIKASGGPQSNQWEIPWENENAAGSCSLIEAEVSDGISHRFLLDTGWNTRYMDDCFRREGVDTMLRSGEIGTLFMSHEHMDHFWGLETVLKYNPDIRMIIPATFYPEAKAFIAKHRGESFEALVEKGEIIELIPGNVYKLFEGCAAVGFDLPIIIRVHGEQSLYFNIREKGMVCVTGCCHQNILTFADFAQEKIVGGEQMYGLYGGLHIAPFGPVDAEREHIIESMRQYDFKKIACNHCTGLAAVEKMIEMGYPIVSGTGQFGSKSALHVGNGDEVVFE